MIADRFDNAKKSIVPWSTPIASHGEFAGIVVPVEGAGVWNDETADLAYIRLRITDIEYNRPQRY